MTDVSRTNQITDESDTRILDSTEVIPAASFAAGRTVEQRIDLPLASLAPGRYLLTVSSRTGPSAAATDERRQFVFVIK